MTRRVALWCPRQITVENHAKGVDLYLHRQGIDTDTSARARKALFQMLSVFAEFWRGLTIGRVKVGLARARAEGKRLGRPTLRVPATSP